MRVPSGSILHLSLLFIIINVTPAQSRGGFRGGGGSYRSSPRSGGGSRSTPSRPAPSPPRTPNTGHTSWTVPKTPSIPNHSPVPSQPKPPQTPTNSPNYGWTVPKTPSSPNHSPVPSQQKPPQTPTSPQKSGWNVEQPKQSPAPSQPHGFQNPHSTPQHASGGNVQNTNKPNSPSQPIGWRNPQPSAPMATTHRPFAQQNPNRQPPAQTHYNYNNGKKYEKGYSKGYDQGYQRGLQQGKATVPQAYYPPHNQFGYPGGFSGGHGSYTYGGNSLHGSPSNYGYPVNSGYGYSTYGTGHSGPGLGTGLAVGVVGGYLLNSALHSSPFSYSSSLGHSHAASSPWGYSGAGYGSDYRYTRIDNSVTNNYYFNEPPPIIAGNSSGSDTDHWVHCIAYDPMTETTLTNPNCTCTVAVETDVVSNASSAVHSCKSAWGTVHTERTPLTDIEVFEIEKAANRTANPDKLKASEIEEQRKEFYRKLETLTQMGCFAC